MRGRLTFSTILMMVLALSLGVYEAGAKTSKSKSFSGTDSGTGVTVPLDIDNDSCTTTAPFVCTDLSSYANVAGVSKGGFRPGSFTRQGVSEITGVPGTGCLIDPTTIKSCTLGASTNACEFTFEGGSYASRDDKTGDLLFGFVTPGGSECIDFSTTPFNFSGSADVTITGGTGKLAGVTGTLTDTFSGQEMSSDSQGHGFSWFTESFTGTETRP
jgi:hypothetical protein